MINNTGSGYKYCFTGASAADLGDPTKWHTSFADPSGTIPASIGSVNSAYATNVLSATLSLPCCSNTHSASRKTNTKSDTSGTAGQIAARQLAGLSGQQFKVYPVPAKMTINFAYSLQQKITIRIFDVTGRLMDEQVLENSTSAAFNVADYASGIYLYQVITGSKVQSGKIQIEK